MFDSSPELPPRVRRILELIYSVEGVTAARVWHQPNAVSVGVRAGTVAAPHEVLLRVESAVSVLKYPDETWDFGYLDS